MADTHCGERVQRLLELACELREINKSQIQMDSISARGSGQVDRMILRLRSLNIPEELKASAAVELGLGIDALNQRVDRGLREINTPGVPFAERRELSEVMGRNLEDIRNDTARRLFDLAVADVEQCARGNA